MDVHAQYARIPEPPAGPRWLRTIAAWTCLLLGLLGLILPIIPGLVLLGTAATLFAGTSPRMYRWVTGLPWIGEHLRVAAAGEGLTPAIKGFSVMAIMGTVIYAFAFLVKETALRILLLLVALAVIAQILSAPTVSAHRQRLMRLLPATLGRA